MCWILWVVAVAESLSRVQTLTACAVAHQYLYPWDFPVKNAGVGCHFLLQGILTTQGPI